MMIRMRYNFRGMVQGVGFRYTACRGAEMLGLTGWVRNEYNGSVTVEIQGREDAIKSFLKYLENGRFISIEEISSKQLGLDPDERSFDVAGY